MSGTEEFVSLLESKGRRVYVTEDTVDLRRLDQPNEVYVLQMPDGSTAAGGRGAGFGERRVVKVYRFVCGNGQIRKLGEFVDEGKIEGLDLPYHATAFPILLADGKEKLVTGVVDRELVASYRTSLS